MREMKEEIFLDVKITKLFGVYKILVEIKDSILLPSYVCKAYGTDDEKEAMIVKLED